MSSQDPVENLANIARIVVHTQYAYDVIDEMASNPEKYIDSLYKLSRLAVKLYDDLRKLREEDIKSMGEEADRVMKARKYALDQLRGWNKLVEDFIEHIRQNASQLRNEIRKFATLAISVDSYSMVIRDLLEKG
ncbi:hypothetical protein [Desulfurococcus amylolyticus]|uniref:Uncharacterized protein n=1 Tax=Desulfurococcus amylolyticus DSM 16532 TaxID=768672 RepID=I3XQW5_DESAM|nr:hypothetical protein [Desulfurococcus amylolyticus]AFL66339.1 hypothetical protein Desfe_0430 [Desulfurococcus amylolyticus DSM 16532]